MPLYKKPPIKIGGFFVTSNKAEHQEFPMLR